MKPQITGESLSPENRNHQCLFTAAKYAAGLGAHGTCDQEKYKLLPDSKERVLPPNSGKKGRRV